MPADVPDTIIFDDETGVCVFEAYFVNEELHRVGGAAWIERDRATGVVTSEWWYRSGLRHREDGPAVVERNDLTGAVVLQEWWQEGELIDSPRQVRSLTSGHSPPSP